MNTKPAAVGPIRIRRSARRPACLLVLMLTFAACPAAVQAAATNVVVPDDVVAAALAHSPELHSAAKQVEAAAARERAARAGQYPSVALDLRASRYAGLEEASLGPGIVIPEIDNRFSAAVILSQPLYTGERITSLQRSTAWQRAAAGAQRRSTETTLRLQALRAYWDWSKSFFQADSLRASVARVEAHAADMHNLHEAGLATDNDALATDVLLDQTRLRLEDAQARIDLARARIGFLTGCEPAPDAMPLQPAPAAPAVPDEADALAAAHTNRPERAAQAADLQAAAAQAQAVAADRRPQVFLRAGYEQAQPNPYFFPPAEQWDDDAFAGVVVSWTIFDAGLDRAHLAEAHARVDQARLRLQAVDDEIALDVKAGRIALANALRRVPVAEHAEQSARRNIESATDLWDSGLARHADVLDAQASLIDAQYQTIAARADVALARAELEFALGPTAGE